MGEEEGAKVLVWPGQSSDEPTGPNLTHPTPDLCSQASLQGLSQRGGGRQGGHTFQSPQMAAQPVPGALLWDSGWNRVLRSGHRCRCPLPTPQSPPSPHIPGEKPRPPQHSILPTPPAALGSDGNASLGCFHRIHPNVLVGHLL